ncbi:MAG: endolytic transglycosylase MltG [Legionellales bacterium]|nr:endolytic transglycosylase MltG [Legionellales bacterium]
MTQQRKLRLSWHVLRLITIFVIMSCFAYGLFTWIHFLETPIIKKDETFIYTLKPGSGLMNLAWDLHRAGKMPHPRLFILMTQLKQQANKLQAGFYEFKGPLTPLELLDAIVSGKTRQSRITLIEGWTFKEALQAINANPDLTHELRGKSPQEIIMLLGIPETHLEGLFYPDTYHFPRGTTDVHLLKIAYQLMQKHLLTAWQQRSDNLPFTTPYQALIAASLVEKETALIAERPKVAGVLIRRLQKKMLLQFDPTVIYGLGKDYTGNITRADLRKDTPYNTYLHPGLPPSPIALPSLSSIQAVMHPDSSNALYFVADGRGGHVFSDTLAEHNQAVANYLRQLKNRKNSSPINPLHDKQPDLKSQSFLIDGCENPWQEGHALRHIHHWPLCELNVISSGFAPRYFNRVDYPFVRKTS